jgi:hypothetical protein
MRISSMLVVVALVAAVALAATPTEQPAETAGATSLLTAERRAREAADRLRLPDSAPARWMQSGGWTPAWQPDRPPASATPP